MLRNIFFGRVAKPSPDVEEEEEHSETVRPSRVERSFKEQPYKRGLI